MDARIGRRALAGLAAVAVVSATGFGDLLAKGKNTTSGKKGNSSAPGQNKVAICHYSDDTGLYTYMKVPPTAVKGHSKHGDVVTGVTGPDVCAALNPPPPTPTPTATPSPSPAPTSGDA